MVDFVLKVLRKFIKMSPKITKLLSFPPILLATRSNAFQHILFSTKFCFGHSFFLKSSETYARKNFIKIRAKQYVRRAPPLKPLGSWGAWFQAGNISIHLQFSLLNLHSSIYNCYYGSDNHPNKDILEDFICYRVPTQ